MKYTENHKLGDVISEHYKLLLVMSRFGIPLGFGDATIGRVCQKNGVDANTFLAVLNYVANGDASGVRRVSLTEMVKFLKNSHHYYLNFLFPELRRKLIYAIDFSATNTLSSLILGFFDDYVAEVSKHLSFEDNHLFRYVEMLSQGAVNERPAELNAVKYSHEHEQIDSKILELKNIMIKYYPDGDRAIAVNAVLHDIFMCEKDFKQHCDIEDALLVPAVAMTEEGRL